MAQRTDREDETLDRPAYRGRMGDERRLARRLRRVTPVLVSDPVADLVVRAFTEDISLFGYGLRFDDPIPFAKGQRLLLSFEETNARAEGLVRWSYLQGDSLNAGLERVPIFSGNLAEHPVSRLLLDIERTRSTGLLHFENADARVLVYLDQGQLCHSTSSQPQMSLSRILFRLKRVTKDEVADVEQETRGSERSEQDILLQRELIKQTEVLPLLRLQAEQTIAQLFSWDDGSFSFEPLSISEFKIPRMALDPGRIVTMGMRRISPELILPYLPPDSAPLSLGVDPFRLNRKTHLGDHERRILELIDGRRTAGEVLKLAGFDEASARRSLGLLVGTVLVEPGEEIAGEDQERVGREVSEQERARLQAEIDTYAAGLADMTFYDALGLDMSASDKDVKRSFHKFARRFHPDQNRKLPRAYQEKLHDIFSRVQEAYGTLSNAQRRQEYDRKLGRYAVSDSWARSTKRTAPGAEEIFAQGQASYKADDYEAAAESFKWAARISSTRSNYHFAAAEALAKLPRRRKEAEDFYRKAIELAPYNVDYLVALARFYLDAGLGGRAEGVLRDALKRDPDHAGALKLIRQHRV